MDVLVVTRPDSLSIAHAVLDDVSIFFSWPILRSILSKNVLYPSPAFPLPTPQVLCYWHLTFMFTCVEHRKRNSHLHCLTGHLWTSTSGAVQGLPPFTGGGLVHERKRFLCVRPQRRHWVHEDHSDKPPSTAKEQVYVSVFEKSDFLLILIEGSFWQVVYYSVLIYS